MYASPASARPVDHEQGEAIRLTIGIKALNEEAHISDALASAVAAARPFNGEVILADSGSTDRTLEIARAFPVRIVQLEDWSQRCCGAGAQLAFQQARGAYFYLLDGDMILDPDFLPEAIAHLDAHPERAGVGGLVREVNTMALEFQIRAKKASSHRHWLPGLVDRLDCGGLYRASAIREAGYFADLNLRAFEEFDLAARLRSRGWTLARIDKPAIDHFGHQTEGYRLLFRRIKSGYLSAHGQVLRAAIGKAHLPIVLADLSHIRVGLMVAAWWGALLAGALAPLPGEVRLLTVLALIGGPLALLCVRRRSLKLGLFSFVSWNANAVGLATGFFRRRQDPHRGVAARELQSPPVAVEAALP